MQADKMHRETIRTKVYKTSSVSNLTVQLRICHRAKRRLPSFRLISSEAKATYYM